jgi:hypothetical protein
MCSRRRVHLPLVTSLFMDYLVITWAADFAATFGRSGDATSDSCSLRRVRLLHYVTVVIDGHTTSVSLNDATGASELVTLVALN